MDNNSVEQDRSTLHRMFFFPSGSGGDFLTNVWAYWTWDDWSISGNHVNQFSGPSVRIGTDIVNGVVELGLTVPFVTAHWPEHWLQFKDYYVDRKPFGDRIYRLVVEPQWSEVVINNSIMKDTGTDEIDYDVNGNPDHRLDAVRTFRNTNEQGWIEHGLDGPLFKKIYWGEIFRGDGFIELYREWGLEMNPIQIQTTREIFRLYNKRNRYVWRSYIDYFKDDPEDRGDRHGIGDAELLYIPPRNISKNYDMTWGSPNGYIRTFY
jgi:hypothetical protein